MRPEMLSRTSEGSVVRCKIFQCSWSGIPLMQFLACLVPTARASCRSMSRILSSRAEPRQTWPTIRAARRPTGMKFVVALTMLASDVIYRGPKQLRSTTRKECDLGASDRPAPGK